MCVVSGKLLQVLKLLRLRAFQGGSLQIRDILATSYKCDVLAALQHSNCVCKIDLTVTTTQLEKLVMAMQAPYPALEKLGLSFGRDTLVLSDRFFGGPLPHLWVLELDAVPFPTLPSLLASARNIGYLHLYNIPKSGYISPEALVAGLAALTSLWSLYIGFKSKNSIPNQNSLPPVTQTVLPALLTICYGQLTIVSDVDKFGFVLKSSKQSGVICRPMKKEVQLSFENIPTDSVMLR
jgi:hypothetical protein